MMRTEMMLYLSGAFVLGFLVAWAIRTIRLVKLDRELKSANGFLESERLMREKLNKENLFVHQQKLSSETEYQQKLMEAEALNKIMDENVLLLQKDNEQTEQLLREGQPVIHELKKRLIEANNNIARLKAQLDSQPNTAG